MSRSHVVFGLVFLVVGAVYLLDDVGVLDVRLAVLGPVLLIVAGVALLLTSARADRAFLVRPRR
jgi:hypothetical protein